MLQEAISVVSEVISIRKDEYQNHIPFRLNDPKTNAKTYRSIPNCRQLPLRARILVI